MDSIICVCCLSFVFSLLTCLELKGFSCIVLSVKSFDNIYNGGGGHISCKYFLKHKRETLVQRLAYLLC